MLVSTHSHPKVAAFIPFNRVSATNRFQHTATRRWLHLPNELWQNKWAFQHTATRRWLLFVLLLFVEDYVFQHTATRRWLLTMKQTIIEMIEVSTHSHPKVAAILPWQY